MTLKDIPSAEIQIEFLKQIQYLIENSTFQATYKYALLIAITDITIECGEDSCDELAIDRRTLGERFAELYWPQIATFSSGLNGCTPGILFHSDAKDHVKIVKDLITLQKKIKSNDINLAKKSIYWKSTITSISNTIWNQPVKYLQNINNQFLYEYPTSKSSLILKKNITYCFRRFSDYIIQYAKSGWADHIQKTKKNQSIIGIKDDLESFLFGNTRNNLNNVRPVLMSYQSGKCFYCNKNLNANSDVDHYIPWKKYPRNLAENFVLSCPNCNRSKSDLLAGSNHLEKWLSDVIDNSQRILDVSNVGFISDKKCILMVSRWAYQNAFEASSNTWIKPNHFEPTTINHINLLLSHK